MTSDVLEGIDAFLVTQPLNIYYLTGFTGLAPDEREAYVLITHTTTYVCTNALYIEKAGELQKLKPRLNIIEISREYSLSNALEDIAGREHIKKLGFEADDLTVSEHKTLAEKLTGINLVPTQGRIETKRQYKHPDELAHIKKAAKLTDECFTFIQDKLKPGVTETEIAWEIEHFFRQKGASNAFSPIVAFGAHASQPHYETSNTKLKTQDLVLLDFAAKVQGYCADLTRMVFIEEPVPEVAKAYNTLLSAQEKAIELLQNGERSGAALDTAARILLEKAGYPPYPHSLGHGLGLGIHELPRLSFKHDFVLNPGMVITIEPGIYIPGKYGLRIEDLLLITEQGADLISQASKKFPILNYGSSS